VVILDTDLIDINEINLARKILNLVLVQKVVIITGFEDHALKREAELIGVKKEKTLWLHGSYPFLKKDSVKNQ
jgi:Tfp pilus assembly protein PilO